MSYSSVYINSVPNLTHLRGDGWTHFRFADPSRNMDAVIVVRDENAAELAALFDRCSTELRNRLDLLSSPSPSVEKAQSFWPPPPPPDHE
jgi:hypothetical protein